MVLDIEHRAPSETLSTMARGCHPLRGSRNLANDTRGGKSCAEGNPEGRSGTSGSQVMQAEAPVTFGGRVYHLQGHLGLQPA
jgi:hypothetical protein